MFLSCCLFLYIEVFALVLSREFSIMSLAFGGFAPSPPPPPGLRPGPRWGTSVPRPAVPSLHLGTVTFARWLSGLRLSGSRYKQSGPAYARR